MNMFSWIRLPEAETGDALGGIAISSYLARYGGAGIIVVPRDRELRTPTVGVGSGLVPARGSRADQVVRFSGVGDHRTDGENGGWFRTAQVESGFWGFFLPAALDRYRAGTLGFKPVHLSEYLRLHPPTEEVEVHRGAWEYRASLGGDLRNGTGSLLQKKGWTK